MKVYKVEKNYNPNINDKYVVEEGTLKIITAIHFKARSGFRSLLPYLFNQCRLTKSSADKLKNKMESKQQ